MKFNRRFIPHLLAFSSAAVVLLAGFAPQEPPGAGRLDPELMVLLARLQQDEMAGRTPQIPILARRAGVFEGPAGVADPWIDVHVRGSGVEDAVRSTGGEIGSRLGNIWTARLPLRSLPVLAAGSGIEWIEAPVICTPTLDTSMPATGADLVHGAAYGYKGSGVLVVIYDTGIDYTHDDFRNANGSTRIKAIWDQTDNAGTPPTGYAYGSEWTESDINAELGASPPGTITQQDISGHGTHVAGIAAGNGRGTGNSVAAGRHVGMAPEADLLIIKGGDHSFSSIDIQDGVSWAITTAATLGQPVVINLSLGGHSGAHDGTSNYEIALDSAVGVGKAIVVAAGNEGDSAVHHRTTLLSETNIIDSLAVDVPAYTPNASTGDDYFKLDIWYDGTANVSVTVRAPDGTTYGPMTQGGSIDDDQATGHVGGSSTSTPISANGDHNAYVYVDDATTGQEPDTGLWQIIYELTTGDLATIDTWIFDSSFGASVDGGTPDYSVATPGTATDVITVGAYVTKWTWTSLGGGTPAYSGDNRVDDYASFSSWGPTRDGRYKPEIAAPGQGIMSAMSIDMPVPADGWRDPDGVHRISQGTSQAAPHVTGAVALMFQDSPTMTSAALKTYLTDSADEDSYTGTVPNNIWGYGKLDIKDALDLVTGHVDTLGPVFTIGLMRNPVLTDYVDIYMIPNETLIDSPLVWITTPSATVDSLSRETVRTTEQAIWFADYQVEATGTYTLSILAADLLGNDSTSTRSFAAALVGRAGGVLVSTDGLMRVNFAPGALRGEGYVIGTEYLARATGGPSNLEEGVSPAYELTPDGGALNLKARIEFSYDPNRLGGVPASALGIFRWEETGWVPVEGYVNLARRRVEASIGRLGIYQLRVRDGTADAGLAFALEQNYPNPFNGSTQIRYTLARSTEVEISVLNVRGQTVRKLVDRLESAGRHVVSWDGHDDSGRRLATGVYLILMRVDGRVYTRKMLLLQ